MLSLVLFEGNQRILTSEVEEYAGVVLAGFACFLPAVCPKQLSAAN